jgi:hypothetical protein
MTIASAMADPTPTPPASPGTAVDERDPGAPVARDAIDPDLVKLARQRPKVGVITAAGLVFLCIVFLLRLAPDRHFAGNGPHASTAQVADILAGKVELDRLITVAADPMVSHAIRTTKSQGSLGLRLVPVRGTADRLWIVVSGDGWDPPSPAGYTGRLRKLDDLALAAAAHGFADEHPRPVFASAAAVRAGFAAGRVTTVAGDTVALADADRIALDVVDPASATVVVAFNERLPDAAAWRGAVDRAGIATTATGEPNPSLGTIRFTVAAPVTTTTTRLQNAGLWAARVEPVTHHHQTTWATLKRSPPAGLDVGGTVLPDDQIDLIGLYVARGIPHDAYAVVTGEVPADYWYVLPITIALGAILLIFAWALVRAIRRDLVPARPA